MEDEDQFKIIQCKKKVNKIPFLKKDISSLYPLNHYKQIPESYAN